DYIVNCAAYTAVDKAEDDTEVAYSLNAMAPLNLLKQAEKHDAKLIHISTDYVFDGTNYRPYVETDKPNPLSQYGLTKLQGETNIAYSPKAIIIRTSWLYSSTGNNFVKTVLRLADERDKLTIVADQIGTPTYAGDLAAALLTIIEFSEKNKSFYHGIYHYSNEGVCSWYDFAKTILEIKQIQKSVIPIQTKDFPTPAPRPFYSILDKTKIKNTFDLTIPHWRESLEKCLEQL
ncbi:MAG: dTDP-4-dehydrorhamnose reductase, partial [Bacteroidales bacterium]|nr:dTDP-4-dehydrorhamnose reductase [Bacteroidales bacterium]